MNLICQNKCENKYCENKINSAYIKRIIKLIGPVILGSKPSEIVNIPGTREERVMKLQEIENFFRNCTKIKYRVITKQDNSKRILFINEESMIKCLENKKCRNFLKFLGYPKDYSLKAYIDENPTFSIPSFTGVQTDFRLERTSNWSGMVNKAVYFVHLSNLGVSRELK